LTRTQIRDAVHVCCSTNYSIPFSDLLDHTDGTPRSSVSVDLTNPTQGSLTKCLPMIVDHMVRSVRSLRSSTAATHREHATKRTGSPSVQHFRFHDLRSIRYARRGETNAGVNFLRAVRAPFIQGCQNRFPYHGSHALDRLANVPI
jgi:hypothetical protein